MPFIDETVKEIFSKMPFRQITEGVSTWITKASILRPEGMAKAKVLN